MRRFCRVTALSGQLRQRDRKYVARLEAPGKQEDRLAYLRARAAFSLGFYANETPVFRIDTLEVVLEVSTEAKK